MAETDLGTDYRELLVIHLDWDRFQILTLTQSENSIKIQTAVQGVYSVEKEFSGLIFSEAAGRRRTFDYRKRELRERLFGKKDIGEFDEIFLTGAMADNFMVYHCVCRFLGRIPKRAFSLWEEVAVGMLLEKNEDCLMWCSETDERTEEKDRGLFLWAQLLHEKASGELREELARVTRRFMDILRRKNPAEIRAARKEYEEMLFWMEEELWKG